MTITYLTTAEAGRELGVSSARVRQLYLCGRKFSGSFRSQIKAMRDAGEIELAEDGTYSLPDA